MAFKMTKAVANEILKLMGDARRALNAAEDLFDGKQAEEMVEGDDPLANIGGAIECIDDAMDGMYEKELVEVKG